MSQSLTIPETASWLKERDNFLILTHRRPDGDSLGCAGALAQGLNEAGKKAFVLYNTEVTPRYARFVDQHWAPDGYEADFIIAIDTASAELLPANGKKYEYRISLCIDHHSSNTNYSEYICLDGTYASCGEIIYELLLMISGGISAKSAECLYAAVSTDTGCFAFSNTTANTLRVAAELIDAGAPNTVLNRLLFRTKTLGRIKIEGMIYSGLEFHFEGAVAISSITGKMMETAKADEDDVDDIASIPGSIEGVLAGITIRELTSERDCKVSVRTTPAVNAHSICAHFGGGGHHMAAGFSLKATVEEVKTALLGVLGDFLPVSGA